MATQIQSAPPPPPPLVKNSDGDILVGGTRVFLDTVVAAHLEGHSPEEITAQYPTLKLADVYTAIAYYLQHKTEVEAYLQERRQHSEQVRRENEVRFPAAGIRDRLTSRRDD